MVWSCPAPTIRPQAPVYVPAAKRIAETELFFAVLIAACQSSAGDTVTLLAAVKPLKIDEHSSVTITTRPDSECIVAKKTQQCLALKSDRPPVLAVITEMQLIYLMMMEFTAS
eukprot:3081923-Rhodomonas_salina.1